MLHVTLAVEMDVIVGEEFWSLVVARTHTYIESFIYPLYGIASATGNVEISQAPVDDIHIVSVHIDQNVLRFQIAMHDAVAVCIVKSHQDLIHARTELIVVESLVVFLFVIPTPQKRPDRESYSPTSSQCLDYLFLYPSLHPISVESRGLPSSPA